MIGLDTNVLLRWLIDESIWPDDNPGADAAVARLRGDDRKTFFVNAIVLAEFAWVLLHPMKQPRAAFCRCLTVLLSLANVVMSSIATPSQRRGRRWRRARAGFADRLIAAINAQAQCAFTATFDRAAARDARL